MALKCGSYEIHDQIKQYTFAIIRLFLHLDYKSITLACDIFQGEYIIAEKNREYFHHNELRRDLP